MNKRRIFVLLLIITLLISYYYVLGSQKLCIELHFSRPYSEIKNNFEYLFCHVFTTNGKIEYEDEDFIIMGGNAHLLPAKYEGINIQGYLKENGTSCTLILAYPALPLESY